jgi:hypothetical protein
MARIELGSITNNNLDLSELSSSMAIMSADNS